MNRSFRLVWNTALGLWVVASEAARGKHKTQSSNKIPKLKSGVLGSVLIAGIGLMPLSNVLAAESIWRDGIGIWNHDSNWTTDIPTDSDDVKVNTGTANVIGNTQAVSKSLTLGAVDDSEGTVTVTGIDASLKSTGIMSVGEVGKGTLTITEGATVTAGSGFHIGTLLGSEGTVTVTGANSSLESTDNMLVGGYGKGTLTITDGAKVTSGSLLFGQVTGSRGSVTVSGSGASLESTGIMEVGRSGNGTLTIADGAEVKSGSNITIGTNAGSEGTVTVTGSGASLESTGKMLVGGGGKGTLTITDGAKVTSGNFLSLGQAAGSQGSITVSGSGTILESSSNSMYIGEGGKGTLMIADGAKVISRDSFIGFLSGSEGTVTVTGSGSSLESNTEMYVGRLGKGTLTIADGATVDSGDYFTIGTNDGSEGSVTVTGSGASLESTGNMFVGENGKGTLTIIDGAKVTSGSRLYIGRNADSEGTVNIGAAQGETATAAGTLTVGGGAVEFGAGTGTLVFNHTNTDYQFTANMTGGTTGSSNINLLHGITQFTGDLTGYKGSTNVRGGTLSIAAGDTLTLGGDYHQTSGTLKIGASSLTNFGKLNVAGTATFAKDAKIDVDVTKANTLAAGTMTKVVEAKTLLSKGFVVSDNSALFDFKASVDGNNVNLIAVQGTDNSGSSDNSDSSDNKATVLKYVQNQNFTSGLGAATVLDKFVQGGTTGTAMDAVVTALGKLETGTEVNDAVAQTLPLMSGSSAKVSSGVMQANGNVVAARQSSTANVSSAGRSAETGTSSGDGFISDGHAWVKPVGSWAKQGSRSGVSGYDAETYGIIGGMDGDINDTTSIGFALSYMNTKADGKGTNSTNHADIDAYQVMFYGQRNLGESFHNLDVTWQAGAGVNQTDGTRNINFMSTTAKSDYTSYTGNLSAGLGRTFAINGDTKLTPSVRADYSYIKDESYQETGADALNLNVRSNTAEAFLLSVNGDLNQRINDSLSWAASAGVGYDFLNEASSSTSSYAGGGAAFITRGLESSPWVMNAGVGVNYALDDATEITVRYDLEGRTDFLSQTATAKFTWVF